MSRTQLFPERTAVYLPAGMLERIVTVSIEEGIQPSSWTRRAIIQALRDAEKSKDSAEA